MGRENSNTTAMFQMVTRIGNGLHIHSVRLPVRDMDRASAAVRSTVDGLDEAEFCGAVQGTVAVAYVRDGVVRGWVASSSKAYAALALVARCGEWNAQLQLEVAKRAAAALGLALVYGTSKLGADTRAVDWASMGCSPLVGVSGAPYASLRVNGVFVAQVRQ